MYRLLLLILAWVGLSGCAENTAVTVTPPAPVPTLLDPTPTFDGTPFPEIMQFQVSSAMPKRGDTVTVSWDVQDGHDLKIETYDLDYFPRQSSPPPHNRFEGLAAAGSMELTIPDDYQGTGWQIYLLATTGDKGDSARFDLVFADVKQMVLLNVAALNLSAPSAHRGDTLTIAWKTDVTTRVSRDGVMHFDQPLAGYEDQLYLDFFAVYDQGDTPDTANHRISDLPLSGFLSFTIPDYPPEYARVMVNIGLNVDGQDHIYDIRSVELVPS